MKIFHEKLLDCCDDMLVDGSLHGMANVYLRISSREFTNLSGESVIFFSFFQVDGGCEAHK